MSLNLYDERRFHRYHSGPGRKKIRFDLLQLQYHSLGTLECSPDVYGPIMTEGAGGTGRLLWCSDFKRKTRLGFGVLWVTLMVVGGEEGGKGFMLTPEGPYMLSNDSATFVVCSSGSFSSKRIGI